MKLHTRALIAFLLGSAGTIAVTAQGSGSTGSISVTAEDVGSDVGSEGFVVPPLSCFGSVATQKYVRIRSNVNVCRVLISSRCLSKRLNSCFLVLCPCNRT